MAIKVMCTAGLVGLLGLFPASAAEAASVGQIFVALQNDDVAPSDVVTRAQLEVARLFALIHVEVVWVPHSSPDAPTARIVKITNWEPTDRKIPVTALGVTHGERASSRRAYVIWPRVYQTSFRSSVGLDTMLAVAIAHEMGHLFLPMNWHGKFGLMRASWDENDLRLAASGLLHFSQDAAVRIAQNLRPGVTIAGRPNR